MKGKTHDLNHDLTFSAQTINCVCHSIRSMFRVLDIYNFGTHVAYEVNRNKIIAALSLNKTQNPKVAITHKFLKSFLGFIRISLRRKLDISIHKKKVFVEIF